MFLKLFSNTPLKTYSKWYTIGLVEYLENKGCELVINKDSNAFEIMLLLNNIDLGLG